MLRVSLAASLGVACQVYFFGYGVLIQLVLAIISALIGEALVLKLRKRPVMKTLGDYSAILTAVLLAISIPPLAPWWIIVTGTLFSIVIVKQLYGGLGFNIFNPAMAGYVLLLISFPVQMTSWIPVNDIALNSISLLDELSIIFTDFTLSGLNIEALKFGLDGVSMATPLDTIKTDLSKGLTISESMQNAVFSNFAGLGWQWVNFAYLIGGVYLVKAKIINWHIPVSILASLTICAAIGYLVHPGISAGPSLHLFSGATMLAAFFIATDPVSASTTDKGRLIYGALIGLLIYIIRTYGGYPDAVAFSVLLLNLAVPLIDFYTQPKVYGAKER
jgi:electron transport complex protein RnfD